MTYLVLLSLPRLERQSGYSGFALPLSFLLLLLSKNSLVILGIPSRGAPPVLVRLKSDIGAVEPILRRRGGCGRSRVRTLLGSGSCGRGPISPPHPIDTPGRQPPEEASKHWTCCRRDERGTLMASVCALKKINGYICRSSWGPVVNPMVPLPIETSGMRGT